MLRPGVFASCFEYASNLAAHPASRVPELALAQTSRHEDTPLFFIQTQIHVPLLIQAQPQARALEGILALTAESTGIKRLGVEASSRKTACSTIEHIFMHLAQCSCIQRCKHV